MNNFYDQKILSNGEKITLYNGDCFEIMKQIPDENYDLILTDPPYGMDYQSGHRKEQHLKIALDNDLQWLDNFVNESYRLLKNNSHIYVFCSHHNVDLFKQAIEKKFKVKNILIWVKNNWSAGDLYGNYATKTEFIIFAVKGRRELIGSRHTNVVERNRVSCNKHPTKKPQDLIEYLISKSCNEKDKILDMFAGLGTTGFASGVRGCSCDLIEKEEKYCKEIKNIRVQEELFYSDIGGDEAFIEIKTNKNKFTQNKIEF